MDLRALGTICLLAAISICVETYDVNGKADLPSEEERQNETLEKATALELIDQSFINPKSTSDVQMQKIPDFKFRSQDGSTIDFPNKEISETGSGYSVSKSSILNPESCPEDCLSPENGSVEKICMNIGCSPANAKKEISSAGSYGSTGSETNIHTIANGRQEIPDTKFRSLVGSTIVIPNKEVSETGSGYSVSKSSILNLENCPEECLSQDNVLVQQKCKAIGCSLGGAKREISSAESYGSSGSETNIHTIASGRQEIPDTKFRSLVGSTIVVPNKEVSETGSGYSVSKSSILNLENCPEECLSPDNVLVQQKCKAIGCSPGGAKREISSAASYGSSGSENNIHTIAKHEVPDTKFGSIVRSTIVVPNKEASEIGSGYSVSISSNRHLIPEVPGSKFHVLYDSKQVVPNKEVSKTGFGYSVSKSSNRILNPENCPEECSSPVNAIIAERCRNMGCLITSALQRLSMIGNEIVNPLPCPSSCKSPATTIIEKYCEDIGCLTKSYRKIKSKRKNNYNLHINCPDECLSPRNDEMKNICQANGCLPRDARKRITTATNNTKIRTKIYIHKKVGKLQELPGTKFRVQHGSKLFFPNKQVSETGSGQLVSKSSIKFQYHKNCPKECLSPENVSIEQSCIHMGCSPGGAKEGITTAANSAKTRTETNIHKKAHKRLELPDTKFRSLEDSTIVVPNKEFSETGSGYSESKSLYRLLNPENCPKECSSPDNILVQRSCKAIGCSPGGAKREISSAASYGSTGSENNIHTIANGLQDVQDSEFHVLQGSKPVVPNKEVSKTRSGYSVSESSNRLLNPENCPEECSSPENVLIEKSCDVIGCSPGGAKKEISSAGSNGPIGSETNIHKIATRLYEVPDSEFYVLHGSKQVVPNKEVSESGSGYSASESSNRILNPENCPEECLFPENDLVEKMCIDIGCYAPKTKN